MAIFMEFSHSVSGSSLQTPETCCLQATDDDDDDFIYPDPSRERYAGYHY